MQVKKVSEPSFGGYQNGFDSKQVKSDSRPSFGISNAPDSFQNSNDATSNTMGAGGSQSSSNEDHLRYRNQLTANNNENNLSQSGNFLQSQNTAHKDRNQNGYRYNHSGERQNENNLRQRPDQNSVNSEFNGSEAAKQIQDRTRNMLLLPGMPIKTYTGKDSK